MAEHKPLPALPATHNLLTLSIDARAHRARLIRHILSEVADPVIQSRLEGWARTIEEALDELSSCIGRGDWLAGIRRRRESQLLARLDSLLAERTVQPEPRKDPSKENRLQSSASPNQHPPPSLAFPSVNDTQSNRTRGREVLQQLRAHLSRHNVPTPDAQQLHLLLCLAPCTTRVHFPAEDHGFDIIPGNISCTFISSKFSLPSDVDHIETAVLYGMKEWDGQFYISLLSPKLILPYLRQTLPVSASSAAHFHSKASTHSPNTKPWRRSSVSQFIFTFLSFSSNTSSQIHMSPSNFPAPSSPSHPLSLHPRMALGHHPELQKASRINPRPRPPAVHFYLLGSYHSSREKKVSLTEPRPLTRLVAGAPWI